MDPQHNLSDQDDDDIPGTTQNGPPIDEDRLTYDEQEGWIYEMTGEAPPGPPSSDLPLEDVLDVWLNDPGRQEDERREDAVETIRTWERSALSDPGLPLDLSGMGLTTLPAMLPPSLEQLNVDRNRLTALPNDLPEALIDLSANENRLVAFPETLPDLNVLEVAHNMLEALPDNLPHDLSSLDASHNPLRAIPDLRMVMAEDGRLDLRSTRLSSEVLDELANLAAGNFVLLRDDNIASHTAENAAQVPYLSNSVGAQMPPLSVARPDPPAPVVTGVPFYHEDQVALGGLRQGMGNTCPSHALNAVLGGPVTSYESQEAVTLDGFDRMVEALDLPAPGWRDYGAGFPPPANLEDLIGPRRAVVQLTRWDPATGSTGAHFLALRGDGAEPGWRAIDSMQQEQAGQSRQPVVGATLTEALTHYLEQPGTQVSVGTWLPGMVLPSVEGGTQGTSNEAAEPAPLGSDALEAFAAWLAREGMSSLQRVAELGMVPEGQITAFLDSEAAASIEEQVLRDDIQALVERVRRSGPSAATRPQPDDGPVSDAHLAGIIEGGEMDALHILHMGVTNTQWRGQADAVLTLLSRLPPLPPPPRLQASYEEAEPPQEPETSWRSDIMAAVADAVFEVEAGTVRLEGRSPAQQGHLVAALAYASVTGLVLDLEHERFGPLAAGLENLGNGTPESAAARDAGRLLLERTNRRIAATNLDRISGETRNILRALGLGQAGAAPDPTQVFPETSETASSGSARAAPQDIANAVEAIRRGMSLTEVLQSYHDFLVPYGDSLHPEDLAILQEAARSGNQRANPEMLDRAIEEIRRGMPLEQAQNDYRQRLSPSGTIHPDDLGALHEAATETARFGITRADPFALELAIGDIQRGSTLEQVLEADAQYLSPYGRVHPEDRAALEEAALEAARSGINRAEPSALGNAIEAIRSGMSLEEARVAYSQELSPYGHIHPEDLAALREAALESERTGARLT